jgi:transposase
MLLNLERVFVHRQSIDMRSGFEKLTYLIEKEMGKELSRGSIFIFLGNNRKRLKALFFDGTGLVLLAKRMEKHLFMHVVDLDDKSEIEKEDLELLFHGATIRRPV